MRRNKNSILSALTHLKNLKLLVDVDDFDAHLWVIFMLKFHPHFTIDKIQNAGCPLISEQIVMGKLNLDKVFQTLVKLKPIAVIKG